MKKKEILPARIRKFLAKLKPGEETDLYSTRRGIGKWTAEMVSEGYLKVAKKSQQTWTASTYTRTDKPVTLRKQARRALTDQQMQVLQLVAYHLVMREPVTGRLHSNQIYVTRSHRQSISHEKVRRLVELGHLRTTYEEDGVVNGYGTFILEPAGPLRGQVMKSAAAQVLRKKAAAKHTKDLEGRLVSCLTQLEQTRRILDSLMTGVRDGRDVDALKISCNMLHAHATNTAGRAELAVAGVELLAKRYQEIAVTEEDAMAELVRLSLGVKDDDEDEDEA